jgi:transcriptional regulator with XRE-family HTH domain
MKLGEQKEHGKGILGQNIRKMRFERGMSQRLLAELSGVSCSVIAEIESGVTWNPGLFTVINIARAFQTTLSVLLKDEER